jgi:hypothetical protein
LDNFRFALKNPPTLLVVSVPTLQQRALVRLGLDTTSDIGPIPPIDFLRVVGLWSNCLVPSAYYGRNDKVERYAQSKFNAKSRFLASHALSRKSRCN